MTHEEQLKNQWYRNWVKAGIALKYLKDGIETFVDDGIKDAQNTFLQDIRNNLSHGVAFCDGCATKNVIPCPTYGICNVSRRGGICNYHDKNDPPQSYRKCPNNVCDRLYQKIQDHHRYTPAWKNTDASMWCKSHWEIAKCFLPLGNYGEKTSASETDCSGLLNVIVNCSPMQNRLNVVINPHHDIVSKNIKARNAILHSPKLELAEQVLHEYIDGMITLLQDTKILVKEPDAILAVEKLKQLKLDKLVISTKDSIDVREEALAAIAEKKNEAIEDIEAKRAEAIQQLSGLQKDVNDGTQSQMKAIQSNIELQIDDLRQENEIKMDAIECSIERLPQQKHTIDYQTKKQGLQNTLTDMYRKHLSKIPVSPVLDEIDVRVDDVFVELIICDDLVHEPNTLENKRTNGKKIKCYHDILFKTDTQNKSIYIIGDAGIGKTTWCMKLISTWVSVCEKSKIEIKSETEELNDEKTLSAFDFLFFVSLRHATSERNIQEMITNQLFEEHPHLHYIFKYVLENESEKCLVILDGLDEWSPPDKRNVCSTIHDENLPRRKGLCGCTVLTTTRPWKLNLIRLKDKDIDRAVKIQGLENQGLLAKRIIDRLNAKVSSETGQTEEKTYTEFKNEVKIKFITDGVDADILDLPEFMKVPLILTFMVCLWFDDGQFERTLASNYTGLLEFIIKNAEGNKRSRKKRRLYYVPNLELLKQQWIKETHFLPECLQNINSCKEYSKIILILSRLAFVSLFDTKQSSLVFTDASLQKVLTGEELDVALQIGFVSQTKVVGKALTHMANVSFLHKTLQEYLAAVHMVSSFKQGSFESIKTYSEYCSSYERVKEMENVLVFVCGMCPQTASLMSKHIAQLAPRYKCDVLVMDQEEFDYLSKDLPLRCVQEINACGQSYPSTEYPIYRDTVNFDTDNICSDRALHHITLIRTNMKHLTSLCVHTRHPETCNQPPTHCEARYQLISDVFSNINHADKLTLLEIHNAQDVFNKIPRVTKELGSLSQLQELVLCNITCSNECDTCHAITIDLSLCKYLKHFRSENMSSCIFMLYSANLKEVKITNNSACTFNIYPTQCESSIKQKAQLEAIICDGMNDCYLKLSDIVLKLLDLRYCKKCSVSVDNMKDQLLQTHLSSIDTVQCSNLIDCKFEFAMEVKVGSIFQRYYNVPGELSIRWRNIVYTRIYTNDNCPQQTLEIQQLSENIEKQYIDVCMQLVTPSLQYVSNLLHLKCSSMSETGLEAVMKNISTTTRLETIDISDPYHNIGLNVMKLVLLTNCKYLKLNNISENVFDTMVSNVLDLTTLEKIELSSKSLIAKSITLATVQHNNIIHKYLTCDNISENNLTAICNISQLKVLDVSSYRYDVNPILSGKIGEITDLKIINLSENIFKEILSNLHNLSYLNHLKLSDDVNGMSSMDKQVVCWNRNADNGLECELHNISEKALEELISRPNICLHFSKLTIRHYRPILEKTMTEKIIVKTNTKHLFCTELSECALNTIVQHIHMLTGLESLTLSSRHQDDINETQTISWIKDGENEGCANLVCCNISKRSERFVFSNAYLSTHVCKLELQNYYQRMELTVLKDIAEFTRLNDLSFANLSEIQFNTIASNMIILTNIKYLELEGFFKYVDSPEGQSICWEKHTNGNHCLVCSNLSEQSLIALADDPKMFSYFVKIKLRKIGHIRGQLLEKVISKLQNKNELNCTELSEVVFDSLVSNIYKLPRLKALELSGFYKTMSSSETQILSYDEHRVLVCHNISETSLESLVSNQITSLQFNKLILQNCYHILYSGVVNHIQVLAGSICFTELSESEFETVIRNIDSRWFQLKKYELSGHSLTPYSDEIQTIFLSCESNGSHVLQCNNITETSLNILANNIDSKPPYLKQLELLNYKHNISQLVIDKVIALKTLRTLIGTELPESSFIAIMLNMHSLSPLDRFKFSCSYLSMESNKTRYISFDANMSELICNDLSERTLDVLVTRLAHCPYVLRFTIENYRHNMSQSIAEKIVALQLKTLTCTGLSESVFDSVVSHINATTWLMGFKMSGDFGDTGTTQTQTILFDYVDFYEYDNDVDDDGDGQLICINVSERTLHVVLEHTFPFEQTVRLTIKHYGHNMNQEVVDKITSPQLKTLTCTELSESVFDRVVSHIHAMTRLTRFKLTGDYGDTGTTQTQTIIFGYVDFYDDDNDVDDDGDGHLICLNVSERTLHVLLAHTFPFEQTVRLTIKHYGHNMNQEVVDKINTPQLKTLTCTELSESVFDRVESHIHAMTRLTRFKLSGDCGDTGTTQTQTIIFDYVDVYDDDNDVDNDGDGHLICINVSERTLHVLLAHTFPFEQTVRLTIKHYGHNMNQEVFDKITSPQLKTLTCTELSESVFDRVVSHIHAMTRLTRFKLSGDYGDTGTTQTQTIIFDYVDFYDDNNDVNDDGDGQLICINVSERTLHVLLAHTFPFEQTVRLTIKHYWHNMNQEVFDKITTPQLKTLTCTELSESVFDRVVSHIHAMTRLTRFKLSGDYGDTGTTHTQTILFGYVDFYEDNDVDDDGDGKSICMTVSERTLHVLLAHTIPFEQTVRLTIRHYGHNMNQAVFDKITAPQLKTLTCTELSESVFDRVISHIHAMTRLTRFRLSGDYGDTGTTQTQYIIFGYVDFYDYDNDVDDDGDGQLICMNVSERTLHVLLAHTFPFEQTVRLTIKHYGHNINQAVFDKITAPKLKTLTCTGLSESVFDRVVSHIHAMTRLTRFQLSGDYGDTGTTQTQSINFGRVNFYDAVNDVDDDGDRQLVCINVSERTLHVLQAHTFHFEQTVRLLIKHYE